MSIGDEHVCSRFCLPADFSPCKDNELALLPQVAWVLNFCLLDDCGQKGDRPDNDSLSHAACKQKKSVNLKLSLIHQFSPLYQCFRLLRNHIKQHVAAVVADCLTTIKRRWTKLWAAWWLPSDLTKYTLHPTWGADSQTSWSSFKLAEAVCGKEHMGHPQSNLGQLEAKADNFCT